MSNYTRLAFGAVATLMLLTGIAYADDDSDRWFGYSIVGSWEVEVTVREDAADCTNSTPVTFGVNPFPALNTFHIGGTLSETGARSPPSMRSPGHGVWERSGRNKYDARLKFQGFDINGVLATNMDIRSNIKLSPDGMTFNAVSRFAFSIVDGPTIPFCATMEGVRITL